MVTGSPALIALAGPANKQGRIAADNICGLESEFGGSQGSSVLKLFELDAASTGLTLTAARAVGIDAEAVILSPANHATYYPGAETMTLKVVFERGTGRILGGQAIGRGGVDKRIDVLAVAIRARMTAADLTELDLAYAPPYSSAKDPVNMAGFMIETILSTGLTLTAARAAGIDAEAVILSPANHATYDPGAETMTLKVVFERGTGRILGGQAIGRGGVDKRIDELAVAIRARMSAADLTELDLAYAPPYSSAKDPVNMAGFMIENLLDGLVDQVTWDEALELVAEDGDAILLDTRTAGERSRGSVEGALHITVDELREHLDELPRDKRLLVFCACASGLRSYVACRILSQHGFTCANIAGGYGFHTQVERGGAVSHACVGECGLPV